MVLGIRPYFDEPFYVGGFEPGLQPDEPSAPHTSTGVVAYWGVDDAEVAFGRLLELGATEHSGVQDIGDGIEVVAVLDPYGACSASSRTRTSHPNTHNRRTQGLLLYPTRLLLRFKGSQIPLSGMREG
jgi:hypothetical protein